MILDSFTNQYPTREILSPDILHLKTNLWPASWRQFSMGVLAISHMKGTEIFPCTGPTGGRFEDKGSLISPIEGIRFS